MRKRDQTALCQANAVTGGAVLILLFSSAAGARQNNASAGSDQVPVVSLSPKQVGQSYPLKLTATNLNCNVAQTFEFQLDSGPWLVPPPNMTIAGLGKGQSGTIIAQMDFRNIAPGTYYGHVSSRCTSCGWYILSGCYENGDDTIIKVKVYDPAQPNTNQLEAPNPFAGLKPYRPPEIRLDPTISTSDESLLDQPQQGKLATVRAAVKKAEADGRKARDEARAARQNKNNCERELAQLKAAMDAANRRAGIAAQDAANAEAAANAAARDLANYDADLQKAQRAAVQADRDQRMAAGARTLTGQRHGSSSPEYRDANARVAAAITKSSEAGRALSKVRGSKSARQRAADQAARASNTAKAAAARAQSAANAATARYNAKARECNRLGAAQKIAEAKVRASDNAAKHAVGVANYEESEARKGAAKARQAAKRRGVKRLDEDITKAKARKERCETALIERAKFMTRVFQALRLINVINPNKISAKDVDVQSKVTDFFNGRTATVLTKAVATIGGSLVAGGTGIAAPVAPAFTAFSAMKAGYGLIKIKQNLFTPGRGGYRGNDNLKKLLKDKGLADETRAPGFADTDADRMVKEMERFVAHGGNPGYLDKEFDRMINQCFREVQQLAALQAQRNAAAGK